MKNNSDGNNDSEEENGRLPFLPSRRWLNTYVTLFSVIMAVYCIVLLISPSPDYIGQNGVGRLRNLVNDLGAAMPVVAFLSYWGTEAIRGMVFFSEKIRESRDKQRAKFKAEARAAGLAEGRSAGVALGKATERAEWLAWYAEWKEAQREGKPFNKPAPGEEED